LVFSIHPDGELHWKDILHKKQYSQDDGAMYSSYFLLKTRSNLRFLYNDEIKQESTVNEYILTGKGTPDRKNIMNTQGVELMLVMKNATQVSADEVIIPSERRRQLKLIKLTY
jgi:transketolase